MVYCKSYGGGEPLYFLHGWSLNSRVWDPVIDQLQNRWHITTIDLPGHGKSKPPQSGNYDIDVLADEVAAVIDKPAIIVGWSLGGMVALNIACRYPELAVKLVLVASSPQFVISHDWPCAVEKSVLDSFANDLVSDYRATIMRFLAIQTLGSEHAKPAARELREKVFMDGEPHMDSLIKGLEILRTGNLRERAARVRCPTLLVMGERDTLIPLCSAEQTQQLIPDSTIRVIEGAGHAPFISHCTEFVDILSEFIKP